MAALGLKQEIPRELRGYPVFGHEQKYSELSAVKWYVNVDFLPGQNCEKDVWRAPNR
jgi:hypothetical protein